MTAMKLAGAAWAYVGASLAESAAILQALGVQAMDLIAAPGALLDSREIERDPEGQARRVTEAGLPLSNLLYVFGDGFDDRPLNSVDESVRAANLETFKQVLHFVPLRASRQCWCCRGLTRWAYPTKRRWSCWCFSHTGRSNFIISKHTLS